MAITEKRRIGNIGENIACEFLQRNGFEVKDRNYLRKWGELDIVATKKGIWRFVEVKSISCATLDTVPRETTYRPEENVHPQKLKRLSRAIQTYLMEKHIDADWQLDIVTVRIDEKSRRARCEMIENVII